MTRKLFSKIGLKPFFTFSEKTIRFITISKVLKDIENGEKH